MPFTSLQEARHRAANPSGCGFLNASCDKRKKGEARWLRLFLQSADGYFVIEIRISPPVISLGQPIGSEQRIVGAMSRSDPSLRNRYR